MKVNGEKGCIWMHVFRIVSRIMDISSKKTVTRYRTDYQWGIVTEKT